jgi:hypothetical protein
MTAQRGFLVVTALMAGAAALLGWQQREAAGLREAIARREAQQRERAQLVAENRRLASAKPSDEEMEELVSRLTQAERLRAQLAALREREEAAAKAAASSRPAAATLPLPSLAGGLVSADHWQNVGQATPDAAFETALWAAAQGDLDALAGILAFDPAARQEAATLFGRLPPAAQAEFQTPERLIAVLTAMDIPLGRATILRQQAMPGGTNVTAKMIDATGRETRGVFLLKAEGDRWQLQVPAAAVRKYAAVWDAAAR